MTDTSKGRGGFFGVNVSGTTTTTFFNGQPVQKYEKEDASFKPKITLRGFKEPSRFLGSKLKIGRAKSHIQNLQTAIEAFNASHPYQLTHEIDPNTGENVYRIRVDKDIPDNWSALIGDAVHNLRTVLDYLVCDLVRGDVDVDAWDKGFPIKERAKRFNSGAVSKIRGVGPKAERLILRLKACERWNMPMWCLHWLDIVDKHNAIVPTTSATVEVQAKVGVPGMFLGPDGNIRLLGSGPGGRPYLIDAGMPVQFQPIMPLKNNIEVYRSPGGFQEEVRISCAFVFYKTKVVEGQPIFETLSQMSAIIERTVEIFERSAL
jgi:hypothetical protein